MASLLQFQTSHLAFPVIYNSIYWPCFSGVTSLNLSFLPINSTKLPTSTKHVFFNKLIVFKVVTSDGLPNC